MDASHVKVQSIYYATNCNNGNFVTAALIPGQHG